MFRSNVRPIALAALALIVAGSHAQSSRYSAPQKAVGSATRDLGSGTPR